MRRTIMLTGWTLVLACSLCRATDIWVDSSLRIELTHVGTPAAYLVSVDADVNGTLFLTDLGIDSLTDAKIVRLDPLTHTLSIITTGSPFYYPGQVRTGDGGTLVGNDLAVADWNSEEGTSCCTGRVFRLDPATGNATVINPGTGDPFGLAFASGSGFGDALYMMDFEGDTSVTPGLYALQQDGSWGLYLSDPSQWTRSNEPRYVAFDRGGAYSGHLFAADPEGATPTIWRVDPTPSLSPFVSGPPLEGPAELEFGRGDWFGSDMFVLDTSLTESQVLRIAPDGTVASVATGLPAARREGWTHTLGGLTFSPDGASLYVAMQDMVFRISTQSPWRLVGTGVPGSNGTPWLLGQGDLTPGSNVALHLHDALPSSSLALVIGLSVLDAPFLGGRLIPAPDFLFVGLPTDGSGRLTMSGPWPPGVPPGMQVYFQAWIMDSGAPSGWSATAGLEATAP